MNEWVRNPEFIRHVRAELRPPRMMLAGGISLILCFLASLVHSQATVNMRSSGPPPLTHTFYFWIVCIQFIVLPMWCFGSCLQAIAGERLMKTYDFVRTTRLSAKELLIGYLFGTPIMGYFTVGVSIVIAMLAGLGEHIPVGAMIATYILLFIFCLFVSLCGLLVSMIIEKPRAAGTLLIVVLLFWPMSALGFAAAASPFPGLAALALVPGLLPLYAQYPGVEVPVHITAPFFGLPVPYLFLTVFLYATLGAWIVLALLRNLKKEREEIQLLTRYQALAFAAYLNFLFLGFLDPTVRSYAFDRAEMGISAVMLAFLLMNQTLLYIVGLAVLVPAERLKIWYRELAANQQSYLSESGLPWPWMVIAGGIAFAGMVLAQSRIQNANHTPWSAGLTLLSIAVIVVFAVRDVLFLQWCMLTRMKNPVGKGIGLLWLYYFAAGVISSFLTIGSAVAGKATTGPYAFLTPMGAWMPGNTDAVIGGLVLQTAVCGGLLYLIRERLVRMELATAA
jgi:hypothetical protein